MLVNEKPQLSSTQEAILAAAISCVKRWGIERVTLNDIAREAKVARSTVYSYYANKDDVIRFALLQSAYSFAEKVFQYIHPIQTASERIVEAVMFALQSLPNEPCLALVTDTTLTRMVNEHTLTTAAGFDINTALFRFLMQGEAFDESRVNDMAEFTIRTLFSLLAMQSPQPRTDQENRHFIAHWLLPALGLAIPLCYQEKTATTRGTGT